MHHPYLHRFVCFAVIMIFIVAAPAALVALVARLGFFQPPLSHFLVLQTTLSHGIILYLLIVRRR